MSSAAPIDLQKWIADTKDSFAPPVCNRCLYGDGDLVIMAIGGPNVRKDYHIDNSEEFFFMVEGDMVLEVFEKGNPKSVPINQGEIFRLQSRIPHSPQRVANTIGLVIERKRAQGEIDGLRYMCADNKTKLYEDWFQVNDLVADLPVVMKKFFNSEQYKTGKPIPGTFREDPPLTDNLKDDIVMPKNLNEWITANREEIDSKGCKELYGNGEMQVKIYGKGEDAIKTDLETFFWQLEGQSVLTIGGKEKILKRQHVFLVPKDSSYTLVRDSGSLLMSLTLDARKNC